MAPPQILRQSMRAVYRVCTVRLRARGSAVHKVCLVSVAQHTVSLSYVMFSTMLLPREAKKARSHVLTYPSRARDLDLSLSLSRVCEYIMSLVPVGVAPRVCAAQRARARGALCV